MATAKKTTKSTSKATDIDAEKEAKRQLAFNRRAMLHAHAVSCWEAMQGCDPGDVVEIQSPCIKDRMDIVVVFYVPSDDGGHYGAGLIVRNKGKKYDAKASRKLARQISKLVKSCAYPAGSQVMNTPCWGKEGGFPVDRPETATWCQFIEPTLDEAGEPIPMKPYREAKAPKSTSKGKASKSGKKVKAKAKDKKTAKAHAKLEEATAEAKPARRKGKAGKASTAAKKKASKGKKKGKGKRARL